MRLFLCLIIMVFPSLSYAAPCGKEIGRGVASWYGPGFEGASTQSGEPFDPASLSAAHPTLPFGSVIEVTNMRTAQRVRVRINDRGNFKHSEIDLSEAAARQIGMIDDGTAAVALHQCQ